MSELKNLRLMPIEEKFISVGLVLCLLFYGFAYESTYLGIFLMLIGLVIALKKRGTKEVLTTPLTKSFIALFLVALISLINVVDFREAANKLGNIVEFLIPFFASYYTLKNKSNKFQKCLAILSLVGVVFVAGYGIYQHQIEGVRRITSSLSNANLLGAYLMLLLPFSLVFLNEKSMFYKIIALFSFGVISTALFYSLSRSAILGALITIVTVAFLKFKNKYQVIALVLILLIAMPFVMPEQLLNRMDGTYERFREQEDPRIYIWKNAYEMFQQNPILGQGIGQYGVHYNVYEDGPSSQRSRHSHAHNIFLHTISELGLLGLAVILWIMFKMVKLFYQLWPFKNGFKGELTIALFSSFAGFLVQEQFEFSLINVGGIIILTGVLLGWYIALLSSLKHENKEV